MSEKLKQNYLNYQKSDTETYKVKTVNLGEQEAEKEYEKFKNKLKVFDGIKHVKEAKELAKQMFNIKNEVNFIKAGNAHCVIINRINLLKVVLNSDKEVICYNFTQKERK